MNGEGTGSARQRSTHLREGAAAIVKAVHPPRKLPSKLPSKLPHVAIVPEEPTAWMGEAASSASQEVKRARSCCAVLGRVRMCVTGRSPHAACAPSPWLQGASARTAEAWWPGARARSRHVLDPMMRRSSSSFERVRGAPCAGLRGREHWGSRVRGHAHGATTLGSCASARTTHEGCCPSVNGSYPDLSGAIGTAQINHSLGGSHM